jgi:hypothetical protein
MVQVPGHNTTIYVATPSVVYKCFTTSTSKKDSCALVGKFDNPGTWSLIPIPSGLLEDTGAASSRPGLMPTEGW